MYCFICNPHLFHHTLISIAKQRQYQYCLLNLVSLHEIFLIIYIFLKNLKVVSGMIMNSTSTCIN